MTGGVVGVDFEISQTVSGAILDFANFDIVVVPTEHLAGLKTRQEVALGDEIGQSSHYKTC